MRILVYGAGAVGGFFGGLLARAGQNVHFVARGAQLEALRSKGLTIDSALLGHLELPEVNAAGSAREVGLSGLALVCVKTHQLLPSVFDDLACAVDGQTVLIPLQNGVEADELLAARFPASPVFPAVVYVGATVDTPGVVRHVAAGTIGLGARRPEDETRLPAIRDLLALTGQPVHVSRDIQRERWNKLMWNAAFNSVSAITGREPADLASRSDTRGLLLAVMEEVVAVACARGVNLRADDIAEHMAWTQQAAGLRTSTMVDRERGRAMESDGLLGVVVRKGKDAGVATPACAAVYALLTAIDTAAGSGR